MHLNKIEVFPTPDSFIMKIFVIIFSFSDYIVYLFFILLSNVLCNIIIIFIFAFLHYFILFYYIIFDFDLYLIYKFN